MTIRKGLAVALILYVAGCVPSLHQLYTEKTLIYDPSIVGTWQQDQERWKFVGDPNDKSYQLTIQEGEDKQSMLSVHLVEVGGQRFFDFYPADDAELNCGDWLKWHLLPIHLFFKVEKAEPNLVIAIMDPDTVSELLEEKPNLVKHELIEDDRIVLTDTPENLQKFLLDGVKIEKFFGEPTELKPIEKIGD